MESNLDNLTLQLTKKCNLNCMFCGQAESRLIKKQEFKLNRKKISDILKDAKKLGVKKISLTGGESTLRKDLFDIIKEINSLGISTHLLTNGYLLNDSYCDNLINAGLNSIGVSFHSPTPEIHDNICGIKGSFHKLIKGIKYLKNKKPEIEINITYTLHSLNYLDSNKMLFLANKLKINKINYSLTIFLDNSIDEKLKMSKIQLEDFYFKIVPNLLKQEKLFKINISIEPIFPVLWGKSSDYKINQLTSNQNSFNKYINYYIKGNNNCDIYKKRPCTYVLKSSRILANGEVALCCDSEDANFNLGNINNKKFFDIWNSEKYEKLRNLKNFPKTNLCRVCKREFKENLKQQKSKTILFYYHHFGGLGHGNRILSICKALAKENQDYKVIVINSGSPQPELRINKYVILINLPPFRANKGLFSGLTSTEKTNLRFSKRKKILNQAIIRFNPDIAVFEHFPFGRNSLKKELVEFIQKLKTHNCKIYSSVRDIIEQKVNLQKLKKHLELFEGILVHSSKDMGFITSFEKPGILKEKIFFTGPIISKEHSELISKKEINRQFKIKNKKIITISLGGGIDGDEILDKLINIKDKLDNKIDSVMLITTGPSINPKIYSEFKNKIKDKKNILITKFNPNYLDFVNAADLSISMGGYNSINNALFTRTPTIIFPRQSDKEQIIRAKHFAGDLDILNYKTISEKDLIKSILKNLGKNTKTKPPVTMNGAAITSRFLTLALTLTDLKIRLTTSCNLNCDMCSWKKKKENLEFEKVKEIINQAKILGIKVINFTGGEPTTYNNFEKLIKYAKEKGFKISLSTNGVIDKSKLNTIIKFIDYIDISLDSHNQIIHDNIRGVKGAFNKTLETIKILKKNNLKPHINVTICPDNFKSIHKIIPLLSSLIKSISFTLVDTSINNSNKLKFKKEELESFYFNELLLILKESLKENIRVEINPFFKNLKNMNNQELLAELLFNKEKYINNLVSVFKNSDKSCDAPKHKIRINSNGNLSPCCFLDDYSIGIGNINNQSLLNALLSDKFSNFTNNLIKREDKCSICQKGYAIYADYFKE